MTLAPFARRFAYAIRIAPFAVAVALGAAVVLAACRSSDRVRTDATAPPAEAVTASERVERFGGRFTSDDHVALAEVLKTPERFAGRSVVVDGQVRRACSKKGCWMELAENDQAEPGCRVTFKDYGFFVPTDSAGARAKVQAAVEVKTRSRSRVEHWEREGARFPKKEPDGTAREVALVATAVELSGRR